MNLIFSVPYSVMKGKGSTASLTVKLHRSCSRALSYFLRLEIAVSKPRTIDELIV